MKKLVIGILAHVDAGKTTLSEGILYQTGSIRKLGRVDNRDAFLDNYELERRRGITIFSKQAVFRLGKTSVTLLDTPGHVDFSAEMERTLQVLDYAILLVSGADGVQGHTETLWRLLKRYQIPTFIFVNKMDQDGTDRQALLLEIKKRLDDACIDFSGQNIRKNLPAAGSIGESEEEWFEQLAMCDESAMEHYLESGTIPVDEIRQMIAARKVFPCYFGSALRMDGVEELLGGMEYWSETPKGKPEFGAKVFKISRDEQGNRLTHIKITGGCLKVKEPLGGGDEEKVNQIRIYSGMKYETVGEADAGTICAVTGPLTTYPGQGIGAETESELPLLEPVLTYRVLLPEGYDAHKMLKHLQQLEEEEPELHIVWDEALGELLMQVMGEVQIEVLKSLIAERFGVEVEFGTGNIVYKETILNAVEGVGHFEPLRHYAEVHLLMEPLEAGSGLQFEAACSEDVLDRNWQRLILTHLEERRHKGVLTGSEITDMKITLVTGKAHLKHTEGGDFRQATYRAVRQGLRQAHSRLLEPYYAFRLEVPSEYIGRAMSDVERMCGTFDLPQTEEERSVLTGSVPVATMRDYQKEVIAYTRGRGRLFCTLKGYEPCHNEDEVIAVIGYDAEADLEHPTGSVFCAHGAGFVVPWDEVYEHMHLELTLKTESEEKKAEAVRPFVPDNRGDHRAFGADDKELEAIFTRTYGESKRKLPREQGARRVVYGEKRVDASGNPDVVFGHGNPGYMKKTQEPLEEYLLVDGYNILYAWEDLRQLMEVTVDGARQRLLDILCNYQGYKQCHLIVVFDAYKVVGGVGSAQDYHNIHVVYTKEAETADQYIEKIAHQMGRKYRVTVATSDGLEQLIIRGQGCILMSAKDLREDVERVGRQIAEETGNLKKAGKNYLFQNIEKDMAEYLERMRLGEENDGCT